MASVEESFAQNLRTYRKNAGMTQKMLGASIGYSEKAVSKWESGVLPPVAALVKLADALQTTVDELLTTAQESAYFLGIDGGATKTEFVLTDAAGNVLCRHFEGSCNPVDIGMEAAQKVLDTGIRTVCKGVPMRKISMFAGISGGISGNNKEILHDFFAKFPFAKCDNGSDAQLIVAAGLGHSDGIAVIMGTGSVAFAQENGAMHRIGGLGYLFDNGGNGYSIGRDAIRAALCVEDGSGEQTLLHKLVTEKLGNTSAIASLGELYALGKRGVASYAPLVFRAADEGDGVARNILRRNMKEIAALLTAGRKKLGAGKVKAVFVGGLTNRWDILLPEILDQLPEKECYELSVYQGRAVNGALVLAGLKEGLKDDQDRNA